MRPTLLWASFSLLATSLAVSAFSDEPPALPAANDLPMSSDPPDPLRLFSGARIRTEKEWNELRKPELRRLFQHYMYGEFPELSGKVVATVDREDPLCLGGKATRKDVTLRFGPEGTPPIHLLLVVPNERKAAAPVFVGLNFCGNHALLDDPTIPLPAVWVPRNCPGCVDERATEAGRGAQKDVWALDQSIARGYAVATCYSGDIDPDKNDFADGVHPHFRAKDAPERTPQSWGTIAAWAWGIQRAVDYLVSNPDIDAKRIAVVGHSRLGKTALLAGAFDERIALVIPHQAGCGGSAPSRKTGEALEKAESVKRINTSFPHWFCNEFKNFNEQVEKLPFDQHCLVALCAPRPVLFTNAVEDAWADPEGQFRMLVAASPVYELLGTPGIGATAMPEPGKLVDSRLGYFIRPGAHSMTREDWKVFLDFADKHLGK